MANKSNTVVVIGGKQLKLSGYVSEEYLQKLAMYIDKKLNECNQVESFKRQSVEQRNLFLQINIADDLFKAREELTSLTEEIERKDKELYDLRDEVVKAQMRLDESEKNLKSVQKELQETEKKVVRLETELKNLRK